MCRKLDLHVCIFFSKQGKFDEIFLWCFETIDQLNYQIVYKTVALFEENKMEIKQPLYSIVNFTKTLNYEP